ncbi:MAG: transporter substrate-binding domain-containing protein [Christensenellaceae bacterium]|nr:transporter substrate-binding domain-containing protein [Christensenellaceae bacterium]
MHKYKRTIQNFLKNLFSRRMLPLLACIAGILVVFILVTSMGGSDDTIKPEDTALSEHARIHVGLVPDNGPMCTADEEKGTFSGYEFELIRTILRDCYPDIPVEYTVVDSQIASYQLRNGVIDLAIGTFAKDVTKTQGLSQSVSYYTDSLYAYVPQNSSISALAELQGHTVYLASTEFPIKAAKAGFTELGIELDTVSCSSYPDAFDALNSGNAAALIGPRCRMDALSADLKRIDQRIGDVPYRILAWTDNSDAISLINVKLNEMLNSGALDDLRAKYGLEVSEK